MADDDGAREAVVEQPAIGSAVVASTAAAFMRRWSTAMPERLRRQERVERGELQHPAGDVGRLHDCEPDATLVGELLGGHEAA